MKLFISLLLCCFFDTSGKIIDDNPQKDIDKIIIKCFDLGASTETTIECSQFESTFPGSVRQFTFSDKQTIKRIGKLLSLARKDKINYEVDVRAKLFVVYKSKDIDTICLDGIGRINLRGTTWNLPDNSSLMVYLDSLYYFH